MNYLVRRLWDLPERQLTPVDVYRRRQQHRREFLKMLGWGAAAAAISSTLPGCGPGDEELERAGAVAPLPEEFANLYPAPRNSAYEYGRPETDRHEAAQYTNFYEFSAYKDSWKWVGDFQPSPWTIEVAGMCAKPRTFDMDDVYRSFTFEERAYRHRCVETWAMCVPWTGFPMRQLLKQVEPMAGARYVELQTFNRPEQARNMGSSTIYPWPYTEGLTVDEAANELAFVATGVYGEPLPKQHGAPIRLVIPWKYGFKSIKSIVRIVLTDKQPATFWNTVAPEEYGFRANVDPEVPHPRWSQSVEWMLGTGEQYPTVKYNGYGEQVAGLYRA